MVLSLIQSYNRLENVTGQTKQARKQKLNIQFLLGKKKQKGNICWG